MLSGSEVLWVSSGHLLSRFRVQAVPRFKLLFRLWADYFFLLAQK